MIAKLRNNFFAGLLVVLPLLVTIFILKFFIDTVNIYLLDPVMSFLKDYIVPHLPAGLVNITLLSFMANLLVFIGLIGLLIVLGFMTRIIIVKKIIACAEDILSRLPLVNKVYTTIRQISHAFLGQRKSVFRKVALLEYPRKGIYSIGFITGRSSGEVQAKIRAEVVNVFVPTTPNPTSGVFLMVPEKHITYLDMTVEEGLKLVVSGGAVAPDYINREPVIDHGHTEGRGDSPQEL